MIEEGEVIGVEYPRDDLEPTISTAVLLIHAAAALALIVTSWLITAAFAIVSPMLSDGCGSGTPELLCNGGVIGALVVTGVLGPGLLGLPLWVTGLVKKRPKWLWFGALAAIVVLGAWIGTVVLIVEA